MMDKDTDVVIIGSGFGASVAALRFVEAGKKVTVLERGCRILRENFEVDADMFWQPDKGHYGMNELKKRGTHIVPWLGAGVGGGSHVYAATLKKREFFDDFPGQITVEEMDPFYTKAADMMEGNKYPDYPPYNQLPSYKIMRNAEKKMSLAFPDEVEAQGEILLGISFAPPGGEPGATFINKHGAQQRYSNPDEQKILGGDIEVKNTLDKNYLFLAEKYGAIIKEFCEVKIIEPLGDGGYKIQWHDSKQGSTQQGEITCEVLVCGAGAIGSTQLLLQNKYVHKTLPDLSDQLGKSYFTNGDYVTFMTPKRGLLISWAGLLAAITGWILLNGWVAAAGIAVYLLGWLFSNKKALPDMGTTNSDYIRFKHRDGSPQGMYIEGGRYPTPIKAFVAFLWSVTGKFNPASYAKIGKVVNWMGKYIPFFELLERTWPIPLLMMGRDDAVGHFTLNEKKEAEIVFPFEKNKEYVIFLEKWGRIFSKYARSYFLPNFIAKIFKIVEVPHNMGGCAMGYNKETGVVDTFGRVFSQKNFLVLDGSILPCSIGPNPALTILAFAERSMHTVIPEWAENGQIVATNK